MFHWISITVFRTIFVNSYLSPCLPYAKCFYFHCCCCLVAQSYLTLYDPLDCGPPRSFVHEISQARILDWLDTSFSRGSAPPRDQTDISCIAGRIFATEPPEHSFQVFLCFTVHNLSCPCMYLDGKWQLIEKKMRF